MSQTPNMGLGLPTPGAATGLQWEQSINSNASIVDGHQHVAGQGQPIPTAAMNINANLNYNGFSAFGLLGTTYTPQPSLATLTTLYVIGNELYYNDGAGNVVKITSGGTVNATSSGISSGTASASFSTGVLVVNSASSTPASIKNGISITWSYDNC